MHFLTIIYIELFVQYDDGGFYMNEYEVLIEEIIPCGGEDKPSKNMIEVTAESPRAYVEANGKYPIIDEGHTAQGDLVFTTGDGKGVFVKYTFIG